MSGRSCWSPSTDGSTIPVICAGYWGSNRTHRPRRAIGEAYLRWGVWLSRRIRGDYAFVIWDGRQRQVVAGRDPFGVRPLHYAPVGGQLWLASDVDQFLAAGFPHREPDDQTVVEFLTRDFRTLDRTFFREIARVPPGHVLIATKYRSSTSDYREEPREELTFSSTAECHDAFRTQFFRAVERRLSRKSGSVVLLSGGELDSTAIACAADSTSQATPRSRSRPSWQPLLATRGSRAMRRHTSRPLLDASRFR